MKSVHPRGIVSGLLGVCLAWSGVIGLDPVQAENWAFRRSYFSHDLQGEHLAHAPMPVSRSAYRIPYVPNYPGATVLSTWRMNRVQLRSGSSVDSQFLWEGSIEFRP